MALPPLFITFSRRPAAHMLAPGTPAVPLAFDRLGSCPSPKNIFSFTSSKSLDVCVCIEKKRPLSDLDNKEVALLLAEYCLQRFHLFRLRYYERLRVQKKGRMFCPMFWPLFSPPFPVMVTLRTQLGLLMPSI